MAAATRQAPFTLRSALTFALGYLRQSFLMLSKVPINTKEIGQSEKTSRLRTGLVVESRSVCCVKPRSKIVQSLSNINVT